MCSDLFCSPLNSLQKRSLHISPHYFIQGMNFAVEDFAGAPALLGVLLLL